MTATTFPWACKSDGTPVLTSRWVMIVLIKNWSERIWKGCSVEWLLIKLNYFVSSWCCFSHIAAVIFLVKHRTLFPNQPWCWEEHLQLRFTLHCILLYASYRSRSLGFLDSCPLFLCGLLCAFEYDNLFIVVFTGLQTALLQHLMHMHVKKWGNISCSSCTQQLLGSLLSADWHWVTTLSLHSVVRLTLYGSSTLVWEGKESLPTGIHEPYCSWMVDSSVLEWQCCSLSCSGDTFYLLKETFYSPLQLSYSYAVTPQVCFAHIYLTHH